MGYTVYIIHSETVDVFYKGYTSNLEQRLWEHNSGLSRYTKDKGPWQLVYAQKFDAKQEAIIFERKIKRLNKASIKKLIKEYQSQNSSGG